MILKEINTTTTSTLPPATATKQLVRTPSPNEKVVINVSGMRFETRLITLNHFPNTLLGDPCKRQRYFDYIHNEYFFERHRQSFESILFYYQSNGRFLSRPVNISPEIFFDEIIFFQLGDDAINRYKKAEGYLLAKQAKLDDLPKNKILRSIWILFEFPESSFYARVIAVISLIVIWLSISLFCIETLPEIRARRTITTTSPSGVVTSKTVKDEFFIMESICIVWFSVELFLRFISAPYKMAFVKHPGNIIDFLSLMPYLLQVSDISDKFAILRMIRLVRVFRIFKLAKHFKGLQILIQTFKASAKELALLMLFLIIGVILFSSCVYFFELDSPKSDFASIPDGFWYALITMTTVGYGEMVPKTVIGKCIGCLCAIAGVLTIALPVPIIVSNFNFFYRSNKDLKLISKESLRASLGSSRENLYFDKSATTNPFLKCIQDRARRKRLAKAL